MVLNTHLKKKKKKEGALDTFDKLDTAILTK